ncbi:hypothetical protein V866_006074 [Kwoniella sp. B9012]|uniref:Uncharacterized protein n=1 Tax=Kwoniella europaea PYCC6329 TaxID=1423913 RepID=A0AAX4KUB6_9TREE
MTNSLISKDSSTSSASEPSQPSDSDDEPSANSNSDPESDHEGSVGGLNRLATSSQAFHQKKIPQTDVRAEQKVTSDSSSRYRPIPAENTKEEELDWVNSPDGFMIPPLTVLVHSVIRSDTVRVLN